MITQSSDIEDNNEDIEALIKKEVPQSIKFITGSSKKMANLLDGLLQVSRIGSIVINFEKIDMNIKIQEILNSLQFEIDEAQINVTTLPLPQCMADSNMMDHIFTNLINNAIKYKNPSNKSIIKISGWITDGGAIYCVEDNGIGIAPEHQKVIFDLFHRLYPDDKAGGTGLGLTIVARIVERLSGKIWLESEPNKGSKFFIQLPKII